MRSIYIKECSYFCSEIGETKRKFSSHTINNNDSDNTNNNNHEIHPQGVKSEKEFFLREGPCFMEPIL